MTLIDIWRLELLSKTNFLSSCKSLLYDKGSDFMIPSIEDKLLFINEAFALTNSAASGFFF